MYLSYKLYYPPPKSFEWARGGCRVNSSPPPWWFGILIDVFLFFTEKKKYLKNEFSPGPEFRTEYCQYFDKNWNCPGPRIREKILGSIWGMVKSHFLKGVCQTVEKTEVVFY